MKKPAVIDSAFLILNKLFVLASSLKGGLSLSWSCSRAYLIWTITLAPSPAGGLRFGVSLTAFLFQTQNAVHNVYTELCLKVISALNLDISFGHDYNKVWQGEKPIIEDSKSNGSKFNLGVGMQTVIDGYKQTVWVIILPLT